MISRFDDLRKRISLLNCQLEKVEHEIGSEVRKLLHEKLWAIVEELNLDLNLGLDNTALDLTLVSDQIRIHFWTRDGQVERMIDLFIDRNFDVWEDKERSAVTRHETQRQRALEDPSEGL